MIDAHARSNTRRVKQTPFWLRGLLLLSTAVVFGWSWLHMQAADRSLLEARESLDECRQMSTEILRLVNRPVVAALRVESPQELIQQISNAIGSAGIQPSALAAVTPAEVVRVGSSDYQRRATELQLNGISLPKLAFFYEALNSDAGLYMTDMILTPTESTANAVNEPENWDVRLTLTQIIYSPTSP